MEILWAEPVLESIQDKYQTFELDPEAEYTSLILLERERFCRNWNIEEPDVRLINARGSCYCFGDNTVYLNLDRSDNHGRKYKDDVLSFEKAENLALLLCLSHELTHAVQGQFLGKENVLSSKMLT